MNNKMIQHHQTFEGIKKTNEYGGEFWMARRLAKILEYAEFRNFLPVIDKAKKACDVSGQAIDDHFVEMHEMVDIGSGAQRKMASYSLSRYACYLIVQNADSSKPVIANGQTYFAIQTRRKELEDNTGFQQLSEDQKRLMLRSELAEHNKDLAAAAKDAGVESGLDYAIFQNHGYKGLYGGLDAKGIHQHKGLKKSHKILDHMGSTELAANLFRATQTEEKLKREGVKGKTLANQTHHEVGAKVREAKGNQAATLTFPNLSILLRIKMFCEFVSDIFHNMGHNYVCGDCIGHKPIVEHMNENIIHKLFCRVYSGNNVVIHEN